MKLKYLLPLVLIMTLLIPSVLAKPQPRIRGESAEATFYYLHENGCTETFAHVYVFENKAYKAGDPPENASYVHFTYDVIGQPTNDPIGPDDCDQLYYVELTGTAPLPDGAFSVAGGLKTATLDMTINAFEGEGGVFMDVGVYVQWTAMGKMNNQSRPASALMDIVLWSQPYRDPITTTDATISRIR